MSLDVLGELNWLAVIVATIAFFMLGAVWYAQPVFGRTWQRASGVEATAGERLGIAFYLGPLATCFLSTLATAILARATGADSFDEAIVLALVVGIGYAAAVAFVGGIFDPHKPEPKVWFAIFAGYQVVGLLLAATILALWD
ncbi:MAG: DUF1761 domain-containing protein [Actinomycetota bacterium]